MSPDTSAKAGTVPPARQGKKSVARLEYELLAARPYARTQEEVQFSVHLERLGLADSMPEKARADLWKQYFAKPMACMRTSPLARSYGWGLHFDADGKVALVAMESAEYRRLASDRTVSQTQAMRSKRA